MKLALFVFLVFQNCFLFSQKKVISKPTITQYSKKVQPITEKNTLVDYAPKYIKSKDSFHTRIENEIIDILNIFRMYPKQAAQFLIEQKELNLKDENEYSLYQTLMQAKPIKTPLLPAYTPYVSARCHAVNSGKTGFVGHDRQTNCPVSFTGECISYGHSSPLGIVLQLLYDHGVPSLGHRFICLSDAYSIIGVSLQVHSRYGYNCVLDFN